MGLDAVLPMLRCPHCAGGLVRDGATLTCDAGHGFDVARQGHLNLLGRAPPANADTAEMVAARLRFLDAGHYRPVVDAVAALIEPRSRRWIEVGAGPGWYLGNLLDTHPDAVGLAGDVSVAAVRRAARAHPRIGAVVFDTWRPWPVGDAVADLVLAIFAPRNAAEFARVLGPYGHLIVVTPTPEHLGELRAAHGLLEVPADKADRLAATLRADFTLVDEVPVRQDLRLDGPAVADLIGMGPNAFHGSAATPAGLRTDLSVTVTRWQRRG